MQERLSVPILIALYGFRLKYRYFHWVDTNIPDLLSAEYLPPIQEEHPQEVLLQTEQERLNETNLTVLHGIVSHDLGI
jgi:hypothetical protein